jgi:hypothetical protein
LKNPPIFIIGAGRSGTNMLRDCLCKLVGVETWPCDEINYIWRHGNLKVDTDRFTEENLNSVSKNYILKQFDKFERVTNADHVVEKTCANSLRIPFINDLFPTAKYVCIVRNGMDVAASAAKRWKAPLDLNYILAKAKYVPLLDMPYYAIRYGINRVRKLLSKEKRLAFWGPMYPGIQNDLSKYSAKEVSALQWSACVDISLSDFEKIHQSQVHFVKYEDFVAAPEVEMKSIVNFLGLGHSSSQLGDSVSSVSTKSVGKSQSSFTKNENEKLTSMIASTQSRIDNLFKQK